MDRYVIGTKTVEMSRFQLDREIAHYKGLTKALGMGNWLDLDQKESPKEIEMGTGTTTLFKAYLMPAGCWRVEYAYYQEVK